MVIGVCAMQVNDQRLMRTAEPAAEGMRGPRTNVVDVQRERLLAGNIYYVGTYSNAAHRTVNNSIDCDSEK